MGVAVVTPDRHASPADIHGDVARIDAGSWTHVVRIYGAPPAEMDGGCREGPITLSI